MYNRFSEVLVLFALPNVIIIATVLMTLILIDEEHFILEILLNTIHGVLNIGSATVLFIYFSVNSLWLNVLAFCCLICGVTLIVDAAYAYFMED